MVAPKRLLPDKKQHHSLFKTNNMKKFLLLAWFIVPYFTCSTPQ